MNEYISKNRWIKEPNRPKSLRFKCPFCGQYCYDIFYIENRTYCSYKFCPYCGEGVKRNDE